MVLNFAVLLFCGFFIFCKIRDDLCESGTKTVFKNHVVVTPFIETDRDNCSEPRSGDTVPPLRGSENVENPFSINPEIVGTTT